VITCQDSHADGMIMRRVVGVGLNIENLILWSDVRTQGKAIDLTLIKPDQ